MAKLKCCPFCEGEAVIGMTRDNEFYKEWFAIWCINCGATIRDYRTFLCDRSVVSAEEKNIIECELAERWNKRLPQKEEQNE